MTTGATIDSALQVPYMCDEQIEAAADDLRMRYCRYCDLCDPLKLDLERLIWDYLYPVEDLALDTDDCLGVSQDGHKIAGKMSLQERGGVIKIDQNLVGCPLYPFTLGHEIGHWELHREAERQRIAKLLSSNLPLEELTTLYHTIAETPNNQPSRAEWQANRFSVHLLMPAKQVIREFRHRFGKVPRQYEENAVRPSFVRDHPDVRSYARFMANGAQCSGIVPISQAFGVSIESMAIRLRELKLV